MHYMAALCLTILASLVTSLTACSHIVDTSSKPPSLPVEALPRQPFADPSAFRLSDFNLNGDYLYWEIRTGNERFPHAHSPRYSYDQAAYASLTESQLNSLRNTTVRRGFARGCLRRQCTYYGVALSAEATIILASVNDFLQFFGAIDTDAELNVYLWVNYASAGYYRRPEAFQETGNGYLVVDNYYDCRGDVDTRRRELVLVDRQGNITLQKLLSEERSRGCPII